MREDLLGYLLGAMQPDERREIEVRLAADADLRAELSLLQTLLAESGDPTHLLDPPSGLARRTCEFIARLRSEDAAQLAFDRAFSLPSPGVPSSTAAASTTVGFTAHAPWDEPAAAPVGGRWRISDMVTLGGIALAASLLLFPALASWRYGQQSTVCRDKMHRLGLALVDYSRLHGGLMPEVPEEGPLGHAGVYAPRLVEAGLVEDASLFLCPGCSNNAETFAVPRLADLRRATPDQEIELARTMGGGYGYALGYVENGKYEPLRNLNRATFAVLADKPGTGSRGSLNHGCGGQNVLFEDGHAEFLSNCRLSRRGDELFRNEAGFVGAGIGRDDVVVAPSEARPLRQPLTVAR
ncbi:MAG: hypothetical protein C0483_00710 [Pirellula sp.]|nr:hypothetical protein [Pirellula sp.]